jgi:putative transposase
VIVAYRYRVKSLSGLLNQQVRAVNYVWNYCNDTQKHALKWNKRWPSGFDLNVLTTGCAKELGLHSGTVNAVCEQYAKSRSQHRRPYLRYRKIKDGTNFSRDRRGHWFLNVVVELADTPVRALKRSVGIDLGASVRCSRTRLLSMARGTRKSMSAFLPKSARVVEAFPARGLTVSQTLE